MAIGLDQGGSVISETVFVPSYLYEEVGIRYYAVRSMIQHKKTLYKVAEKIEHWRGLND
jgi:hypothetical protein